MSIAISARNTLIMLLIAVVILISIHVGGVYYISTHKIEAAFGDIPFVFKYFNFYNLDAERNLPTFFSVTILMVASGLLIIIGLNQKKQVKLFQWLALGAIFLFLALDESSDVHIFVGGLYSKWFGTVGFFKLAWVIPYSIIAISIFFLYITFLYRLPRRIAVLFLASGAIYVAGALGFEIIRRIYNTIYSSGTLMPYLAAAEEGLEMLGISIFIYALLSYISGTFRTISIQVNK